MKTILKITRNELSSLFYSPIAWLILIIFAFQTGMTYAESWKSLLRSQELGYSSYALTARLLMNWDAVFSAVQNYLYLYIPLLTMGLMSLEYSRGSIKLLYSSPVTNFQIIFGKYLSMILYALLLTGLLFLCYLFTALSIHQIDSPYALTALLGLFLLICAYAAIGLFMSTLTSYQVVAAVGTLAALAVLNFISGVGQETPIVRDITYWLSISGRAEKFIGGLICSEDLLYFLLVIALFITLSILKLQAERTAKSRFCQLGQYALVLLLTLGIGYISGIPSLRAYYDATEMKDNTLTPNSLEVMKKMDGPLTITTYVNLLDEDYFRGMPRYYKEDFEKFEQYIRFKPEIRMEYVYYYDKVYNPLLEERFPDMTDEERIRKICEVIDWDPDDLLKPEEIRRQTDLSGEGNKYVRLLKRGNGQQTFLRIYEDNMRYPTETEITAALKRMVITPPLAGFLTGHGERNIYGPGERDYGSFAIDKTFRNSLVNQGFDVTTFSLESITEVPENIDILVITDLKKPLSETELTAIGNYLAKGGNLLIAGEPRRQNHMNPLLDMLGLRFTSGTLVQYNENYSPDLVLAQATPEAGELTRRLRYLHHYRKKITMPGSVGIESIADKGFKQTVLLTTDSAGVWNELETTDFIEEKVSRNPAIGEEEKTFPVMVYLTRPVQDKEQRILVLGDADCIGNGELVRDRNGIDASNFTLVTESFRLLSNGEFPVDTYRPRSSDNKSRLGPEAGKWISLLFMGIIPGILAVIAVFLSWKRKRR